MTILADALSVFGYKRVNSGISGSSGIAETRSRTSWSQRFFVQTCVYSMSRSASKQAIITVEIWTWQYLKFRYWQRRD